MEQATIDTAMIDDAADSELVRLVQHEPENFKLIFDKYQSRIRWYIYHKLSYESRTRIEDSIDMTMVAFENLFLTINRHDDCHSIKTLLYTYAKRLVARQIERGKYWYTIVDETEEAMNITNAIILADDERLSPEQHFIQDEFMSNVYRIIQLMPSHYSEAAELYYLRNEEQSQIAKILNVPQSTVEGRIVFAKNFLAKRLNPGKKVIKRNLPLSFTDEEIAFLKNNFHHLTMSQLHSTLLKMREVPMHIETLRNYCNNTLNLRHEDSMRMAKSKNPLSDIEIDYIIANYDKMEYYRIAQELSRGREQPITTQKIVYEIKKLNLSKKSA